MPRMSEMSRMTEMPGIPRMTRSLRPSYDVTARESLINDDSEKMEFIRKSVVDSYSWQDVTSVLINNIPATVATKNEIVKELDTFQQTVITYGT